MNRKYKLIAGRTSANVELSVYELVKNGTHEILSAPYFHVDESGRETWYMKAYLKQS